MRQVQCIITGCRLRLDQSEWFAIGDLFVSGGTFVFLANIHAGETDTCWYDRRQTTTNQREVTIPWLHPYFERRGVFCFPARRSMLNAEARKYVGEDILDALGVEE